MERRGSLRQLLSLGPDSAEGSFLLGTPAEFLSLTMACPLAALLASKHALLTQLAFHLPGVSSRLGFLLERLPVLTLPLSVFPARAEMAGIGNYSSMESVSRSCQFCLLRLRAPQHRAPRATLATLLLLFGWQGSIDHRPM